MMDIPPRTVFAVMEFNPVGTYQFTHGYCDNRVGALAFGNELARTILGDRPVQKLAAVVNHPELPIDVVPGWRLPARHLLCMVEMPEDFLHIHKRSWFSAYETSDPSHLTRKEQA